MDDDDARGPILKHGATLGSFD